MKNFDFLGYLFNDRPGDEPGKRIEVVVTSLLGFIVTGLWVFLFQNPFVTAVAGITSLSALFLLVQTVRGKASFPFILPILLLTSITVISIVEGKGTHDLIWMSGLGVYLLVNIYSRKNGDPISLLFGVLVLVLFVGVGVLEMNDILPNLYGTDPSHLLITTSIMFGIMGVMTAIFHRYRKLLRISRQSQQEEELSREQLEHINQTLEAQVQLRTNELRSLNEQLAQKSEKLQAASEISREILEKPNESINDLLSRATRLISEKLGHYHVGIFLVDAANEFAVLHASNSVGGQKMLANQHQLKVGGTGIVGYVSQSGHPRIALDTGADAVFFNNPYLPDTHSELSLPIKYGNRIIGVLDVQSTQPAAFNDEDTNILMTIANQLAVLMQKGSADQSLGGTKSGRKYASQLSAWDKQIGYAFRPDGSIVAAQMPKENPLLNKAIASGETVTVHRASEETKPMLAVPVKFRDQVIGFIQIEAGESTRSWSEDEILLVQAISDRAALALENARLFENATRRAEQEETISRVTTQIGASTDFDRILQTTIQELGLALGASRSFIQIGAPSSTNEKASE